MSRSSKSDLIRKIILRLNVFSPFYRMLFDGIHGKDFKAKRELGVLISCLYGIFDTLSIKTL